MAGVKEEAGEVEVVVVVVAAVGRGTAWQLSRAVALTCGAARRPSLRGCLVRLDKTTGVTHSGEFHLMPGKRRVCSFVYFSFSLCLSSDINKSAV